MSKTVVFIAVLVWVCKCMLYPCNNFLTSQVLAAWLAGCIVIKYFSCLCVCPHYIIAMVTVMYSLRTRLARW